MRRIRWGERRGSNPRQPESQSGTLPTELRPPLKKIDYSFSAKNLSKTRYFDFFRRFRSQKQPNPQDISSHQ